MKFLKCHAILKSGHMCGARAYRITEEALPTCGRLSHDCGRSKFKRITSKSVAPYRLSSLRIYLEFMSGKSFEEIAVKRKLSEKEVEDIVRRRGR